MADWSHPQLGDPYVDVLVTHLAGKDVDSITLMKSLPSNLPDGAMAYDRATDLFKEWSTGSSAFVNKKLSIAGGGTGADNSTQAKINLGLGSMASQDSSAVMITGGSISGITLDASVITSGIIALSVGGTGASLALGAAGSFLQSNGATVGFGIDGTLLTGLNASNLASGTVPLARLPTSIGAVLQVVANTDTTNDTTALGTPQASTLSVTITPSNSGHRVVLSGQAFVAAQAAGGPGSSAYVNVYIYRSIGGGAFSAIATLGTLLGAQYNISGFGDTQSYAVCPFNFVDTPATTSTIIYKIYFSVGGVGGSQANLGNTYQRTFAASELTN